MVHELRSAPRVMDRTIAGAGLIALDVVINSSHPESVSIYAGGTCGNVLTILSYLGWHARPVACLRGDFAGTEVRRDLQRWGVDTTLLGVEPKSETPIFVERITSRAGRPPRHTFSRRCPVCRTILPGYSSILTTASRLVSDVLERPSVFFFDRLSAGNLALARECADAGAIVVFEPSAVGNPALFVQALDLTHILKYSRERLPASDLFRRSTSSQPMVEVETDGIHGLRYRSTFPASYTSGWRQLGALRVTELRDTAGAGDWCTAGLLHVLGRAGFAGLAQVSDADMREALMFGQALGAWTCRYEGARGGMYTQDLATLDLDVSRILAGRQLAPGASIDLPSEITTTADAVHECVCAALGNDGDIGGRGNEAADGELQRNRVRQAFQAAH